MCGFRVCGAYQGQGHDSERVRSATAHSATPCYGRVSVAFWLELGYREHCVRGADSRVTSTRRAENDGQVRPPHPQP